MCTSYDSTNFTTTNALFEWILPLIRPIYCYKLLASSPLNGIGSTILLSFQICPLFLGYRLDQENWHLQNDIVYFFFARSSGKKTDFFLPFLLNFDIRYEFLPNRFALDPLYKNRMCLDFDLNNAWNSVHRARISNFDSDKLMDKIRKSMTIRTRI